MSGLVLTLIRGLPGSGKTTLARSLCADGRASHFEADQFFDVDGVYQFDRSKLAEAHALCLQRTKDALACGQSVVVSNTFSRAWEIDPYRSAAEKYGAALQLIETHANFGSVHAVPSDVVENMKKRWERMVA